jgi:hypothetical protein
MQETLGEIAERVRRFMKLVSIHKKIRGMRSKARRLSTWASYYKELKMNVLLKYNKEYVKIWINPFHNLYKYNERKVGKKNPPKRFCKQIFHELINIYLEWESKLTELDAPYYLKIWIGDPEFMDSQVVTAIRSEIGYYNNLFEKDLTPKRFPFENVHPQMNHFTWERCVNGYHVWESDIETEEELREIKSKAYKVNEYTIDGKLERDYFIRTGDIWLGHIQRSGNIT